MIREKPSAPSREAAESLAVGALAFLASEPESLNRFLRLTGLGPDNLRSAAAAPGFFVGLLDYFLADETLLMDYARDAGVAPEAIARARATLDT